MFPNGLNEVHVEFLASCSRRFPTARHALNQLRKLGNPPLNASADTSNPSPNIETAISVIGSLAMREEASTAIIASWTSHLGPWVRFLLQEIIFGLQGGPSTAEGFVVWENILIAIPSFLISLIEEDMDCLKRAPYIEPLLIQTWYKTIDDSHRTWILWCSLMMRLMNKYGHSLPQRQRARYKPDEKCGLMLVHHMNLQIPRIPQLSAEDILRLRDFIHVTSYEDPNPIFLPNVVEYTIPMLIRLSNTVMHKRKVDPEGSPNEVIMDLHQLVVFGLSSLNVAIRPNPAWIALALNAGILKVFLRVNPCFLRCDPYCGSQPTDPRFDAWSISIFHLIARLMAHHDVLRSFLLAARKLVADGSENELQVKAPLIWDLWVDAKGKAFLFREIRRSLHEEGMVVCANEDACPLLHGNTYGKLIQGADGSASRRGKQECRLRCTGCSWAIYCSRSCQKLSWKQHRKLCKDLSRKRRAGTISLLPTPSDIIFFKGLLKYFVKKHSDSIRDEVQRYISRLSSSKLSRNQQIIYDGQKNPIICFNFDMPFIPTVEKCVQITDLTTLSAHTSTTPSIPPARLKECSETWYHPTVNKDLIMAIGVFPINSNDVWPVTTLFRSGKLGEPYEAQDLALSA